MSDSRILLVLTLMFASIVMAEEVAMGTVRIYALTEIGTPVDSVKIRIESVGVNRTIDAKGTTSIELPYGVYTLACIHDGLATQFKVVRVERRTPIDVIFGLPLADPGEVDFTPFEVSGRITQAPGSGFGRVKAVGVFTEDNADSKIDEQGRFRLLLRNEGVYRLFVLYGKDIVHEETLDLTFAMRRNVKLTLKIQQKRPPGK